MNLSVRIRLELTSACLKVFEEYMTAAVVWPLLYTFRDLRGLVRTKGGELSSFIGPKVVLHHY